MSTSLNDAALDQLFRTARTFGKFLPREVDEATIKSLYDLLKWGPTAFNAQPARYVFLRSAAAKQRLAPALSAGNREKTLAAPLVVIVANDLHFHEQLPTQFPGYDAKPMFDGNQPMIDATVARNGSLQGAYLIIAARALGLDVGPMSGFNPAAVNAEFFPDGRYAVNFLANIGYGDAASLYPRGPRLGFEEAAKIL